MSVRSIDEGKNIDEGEILKKRTLSIDNYFLFFFYVICKKKAKKKKLGFGREDGSCC